MTLIDEKFERLKNLLTPMASAMVAFSGGVDSTFILRVAHDLLGDRVTALTTTSPTMPDDDRVNALAMAGRIGTHRPAFAPCCAL